MRMVWMATVIAMAAMPAMASDRPAEVLQPAEKWVLSGEKNMCAAVRTFGPADRRLTFAFRSLPLSEEMEILLVARVPRLLAADGEVKIIPSTGAPIVPSRYRTIDVAEGQRIATLRVALTDLDRLYAAPDVTIGFDGTTPPLTLAGLKAAPVKGPLAECDRLLLKEWGVDLAALDAIKVPARPASPVRTWLRFADYPREALAKKISGTTTILWDIGIDGRVSGCHVVQSSGSEALDRASCDGIIRRGRYRPATDQNGAPVASWESDRINWLAEW